VGGGVYAPARGHGAPPLSDLQAHSPHMVRPLPRLPPHWRNWRSWLSSPRDLLRDVWPLRQKRRDGRGIGSFPAHPGICCGRCSISLIVTFYLSCLGSFHSVPFTPRFGPTPCTHRIGLWYWIPSLCPSVMLPPSVLAATNFPRWWGKHGDE